MDKVDLCLSTLGVAPEEIFASGKAAGKAPATPVVAEAVAMGAPVEPAPSMMVVDSEVISTFFGRLRDFEAAYHE